MIEGDTSPYVVALVSFAVRWQHHRLWAPMSAILQALTCVTTWDIPPIGFLAFMTWPSSLSTTHTSFLRACVYAAVPALQAPQMLQLCHEAESISGRHLKEPPFFYFFSCTSYKDSYKIMTKTSTLNLTFARNHARRPHQLFHQPYLLHQLICVHAWFILACGIPGSVLFTWHITGGNLLLLWEQDTPLYTTVAHQPSQLWPIEQKGHSLSLWVYTCVIMYLTLCESWMTGCACYWTHWNITVHQ